jgi:outer membrane protein assembly factor BamA
MSVSRFFVVAILLSYSVACSVVKELPEGNYLVDKVTIEEDRELPRKERITASELDRYVWQSPNKRFLGTNFYVWVYNRANPDKDNWWNRLKRRIGEKPVLYDADLTLRSANNLQAYMESHGYFSSQVGYQVDTISRRKRAKITYRPRQGAPSRYGAIQYDFQDRFIAPILFADTINSLVRVGDIFNTATLDSERERVTSYLRDRGYYDFSVNDISFRYPYDTTGNREAPLTMVVRKHLVDYSDRGEAIMAENKIYYIDQINIFPNYDSSVDASQDTYQDTVAYQGVAVIYATKRNVRPRLLYPAISLTPGQLYDASQVNRTYNNLMSLGYFKSVRITFDEQRPLRTDTTQLSENPPVGYLTCNIQGTPQLKQSYKIDLEGSTTTSFYGLKASVGYQNRNLFRGMESFDMSFSVGHEFMKSRDSGKRNAQEFGVSAGLLFPRFVFPFLRSRYRPSLLNPRTRFELSFNYQDRPYYRRTLSSVTWTYSWSNAKYSSFTLRPIDVNIIDMSYIDESFFDKLQNLYLRNSYTSQLAAGISGSYTYNNQVKHSGRNATLVRVNWETAGNLIGGLEHLFSSCATGQNYYEIFGIRYAQYFRVDVSASRKIMLGEKSAIAGRLYGGCGMAYGNSSSIPFERLFYCGGSNGMRGWVPRMLGPGTVIVNPDEVDYPSQLGDMKLEANLELRFPIWGIFYGATFFDVGNIWFMGEKSSEYSSEAVFHFRDFYKQLGLNTGVGIRLDIKFAVLRLDWGIQLHNPNDPVGERWIHNFKWRNTALNFGVGYPF